MVASIVCGALVVTACGGDATTGTSKSGVEAGVATGGMQNGAGGQSEASMSSAGNGGAKGDASGNAETFACGDLACARADAARPDVRGEVCVNYVNGGPTGAWFCDPIPVECARTPTCDCYENTRLDGGGTKAQIGFGDCTQSAPGELHAVNHHG